MNYPTRLLVCAVVAVGGHLLLWRGAGHMRPQAEVARSVVVQVVLKSPPPEPEPPAEPEATPEAQPAHPAPARRRAMTDAARRETPKNPPPTERPATGTDTTTTPVFGISMESTSSAGTGPALPVGNTLQTKPGHANTGAAHGVKPLAAPAQAYEVTKMPVPVGDCKGNYYTEEAKQAGVEGTVVLKVLVGEDGRVRDVKIVQGLPHGLTESAVRAVKACRYTIGEKDGKPVPVWVPGRIRFVLAEAE
jgi:protein TonB